MTFIFLYLEYIGYIFSLNKKKNKTICSKICCSNCCLTLKSTHLKTSSHISVKWTHLRMLTFENINLLKAKTILQFKHLGVIHNCQYLYLLSIQSGRRWGQSQMVTIFFKYWNIFNKIYIFLNLNCNWYVGFFSLKKAIHIDQDYFRL